MKKIKKIFVILLAIGLILSINPIASNNATGISISKLKMLKKIGNFARNNKEYNITYYGNDEKAINKAIKKASNQANQEGKKALVYIPNGTYNINNRILLRSNVYILCDDQVIINREGEKNYIMFQAQESKKVYNVVIDGGTINGNNGKDSIIALNSAKNITIKNITIKENSAGKHGIYLKACTGINIKNCNITGNYESGILAKSKSSIDVKDSKISYNVQKGIYIKENSKANIKNSIISYNNNIGITANNSTLNMSEKNRVRYNYKHGIQITNGAIAAIDLINVDHNGINDGYQGSTHGICVSNKGTLALTNSSIFNNGWNGVSASGESKVDIHNNYFVDQGCGMLNGRKIKNDDDCGHGIGVSIGSNGDIYNNVIENNSGCGISVSYRAKANIYNNSIFENGRHAIGLTRGAYIDAYSNTIKDNKYNGILISVGSSGDIHDNIAIDNNKVNGISVMDSSNANIKNNSINNNGQNGIGLGAGYEWSEYESATDNEGNTDESKKSNSVLKGSTAIIQKNEITGNRKHGISVVTISKAKIKNKNTIVNNGANGISVQGASNVTIKEKNVINNNKNGIYVADNGTQIKIESNTLKQNSESGIYIKNGAFATAIQKNKISSNKQYGVRLNTAFANNIKKNTLSNTSAKYEIFINKRSQANVGSMKIVKINTVRNNAVKVRGTATDGLKATVAVSGNIYSAKIKKSKFSIKIPRQVKGTNIKVKVTDNAGNIASNVAIVK